MKYFCPTCKASLGAPSAAAEPPGYCPLCGGALTPSIGAREGSADTPQSTHAPLLRRQDAVIAMAILVLLLLLWKLMTRPEQLSSHGPWVQTNIFGSFGVRLAQTLGAGHERARPSVDTPLVPASINDESPVTNRSATTTPTASLSHGGGDLPGPGDSPTTNAPTKFITDPLGESVTTTSNANAAIIAQRLSEEGAKTGDIQFSLFWRNHNDLDLHCIDPKGERIWYNHTNSFQTGGILDVDQNVRPPYNDKPVENIYWPAGAAPAGIYRVFVVYFAQRGGVDPTAFTVRAVVKGKTNFFPGTLVFPNRQVTNWIWTIQYDPSNPDPSKHCRFLPR